VLEDANSKLAAVVTDVRGVSARAILQALMSGETDPQALAELARGRLRSKRDLLAPAVVGRFTPPHAFLLSEQLAHLDDLEEAMTRVSAAIDRRLAAEREAVALLDPIPGVSQRTAEALLAELGADLSRFRTAGHLASWAGMCPGNAQSGGKRLSGKTRKGNAWLRRTLVEVAHVAAKPKETSVAAQYRRIAARRGKKRALIAVGHSVLVMIYSILTKRTPYQELGATSFDARERDRVQRRLVQRLERLGFAVTLAPTPTPS
jgi:transposase